jgi:hypothetical protein
MTRKLLLSAVTLIALAGNVHAQSGVNLSWDDCGTSGAMLRTFACNTNAGSNTLVASFVSQPMPEVVALTAIIDLCSMDLVLPAWWQMKMAGSCRPNAISSSFDFMSGPTSCVDFWQGLGTGGLNYTYGSNWGFNGARILVVGALPPDSPRQVEENVEYYACKVILQNHATVGTGACARCEAHVCIILNAVELYPPSPGSRINISGPISRDYVHWQGAVSLCPFVVDTKPTTWGSVKSMYR